MFTWHNMVEKQVSSLNILSTVYFFSIQSFQRKLFNWSYSFCNQLLFDPLSWPGGISIYLISYRDIFNLFPYLLIRYCTQLQSFHKWVLVRTYSYFALKNELQFETKLSLNVTLDSWFVAFDFLLWTFHTWPGTPTVN